MKLLTRDVLSSRAERSWGRCFGVPGETVDLPIETETDRLIVCAAILADDLRYLPQYAMAQAGPEERFLFAFAFVRLLRDAEAGRLNDGR